MLGVTSCTGNPDSNPQTKGVGIKKGIKNLAPGKNESCRSQRFHWLAAGGHVVSAGGSSAA